MKITDKGFIYTPSFDTDVGKRFRQIIREQEAARKEAAARAKVNEADAAKKTVPMVRKVAK